MDREIWKSIAAALIAADRSLPRRGRRKTYSDQQIAKMYFWTVLWDRPLCFACDRGHYTTLCRPRRLPSYSQFCRRVASRRVQAMIATVNRRLARADQPTGLAFLDGKPLPVSESSRDPDARTGRGNGRFSRGYKLHAAVSADQRVVAFDITPLNAGEPTVAREHLAGDLPGANLLLADANYDSDPLYAELDQHGQVLLTPLKGHSQNPIRLAGMSPARRRALRWWEQIPQTCRDLLHQRGTIERCFANIANFGGGLGPLPSWVRRLRRVRCWVTAKLAIYHARLQHRKSAA